MLMQVVRHASFSDCVFLSVFVAEVSVDCMGHCLLAIRVRYVVSQFACIVVCMSVSIGESIVVWEK